LEKDSFELKNFKVHFSNYYNQKIRLIGADSNLNMNYRTLGRKNLGISNSNSVD